MAVMKMASKIAGKASSMSIRRMMRLSVRPPK
jgi:hypothetical protein